jgi:hypothetical protein
LLPSSELSEVEINEGLYVVPSEIHRIAPEHFHTPVLSCGAAQQKGVLPKLYH